MTSEKNVQLIAKLVITLGALMVLGILLLILSPLENLLSRPSVLAQVHDRGYLKCGITGNQPGFSFRLSQENAADDKLKKADRGTNLSDAAEGMEADLCKAIAIAVFGESNSRVYYKSLNTNSDERINALIDGDIDIIFRSTAMRGLNNVAKNIDQGPVVLFDPIALLLPRKIESINDKSLKNTRICMVNNTLPVDVAQDYAEFHKSKWQPVTKGVDDSPLTNYLQAIDSYKKGLCNAVLGRFSTLHQFISHSDESTNLNLLPLGSNYHVPTVPLLVENDSDWHDLILQTIWTLLDAERKGIDANNIPAGFRTSHWRRMELNETNGQAIINQLGNYGDIYQRNLGEILPERGPNQHYLLSSEGALFSPP